MAEETKVVNRRNDTYMALVDRTTVFGNPFVLGRHGNRDEVIAKFREYWYAPEQADLRARAVRELKGKRIACWCSPQACHGDVIAQYLNQEDE